MGREDGMALQQMVPVLLGLGVTVGLLSFFFTSLAAGMAKQTEIPASERIGPSPAAH